MGKKMSLHLFCVYVDPAAKERFVRAWKKSGNKLDMGASWWVLENRLG